MSEQAQVAMRIRVALVDDHPVFRAAVADALESQPDMEVVGRGVRLYSCLKRVA